MSDVEVSVLTPVLNEAETIAEVVEAMLAQDYEGGVEFLFVDGRSEDDTKAILERVAARDPRVRVLDNPARRTPQALNIALREARGSIVVRMDAHTLYPPDYLSRGVERLRRGDVVWVSGPQVPYGIDDGSRRVALALSTKLGTGGASFRHATDDEIDADTGFTGLLDRAFVERLGGWDEDWPINQDSELGARVGAAGGRMVVLPALAARYIPRNSIRTLAKQYGRYGMYRAKTSGRHPQSMRRAHLIPPAITVTAVAALVPGPQRPAARAGLALYAGVLVVTAARVAPRAGWRDAAWLPPLLTTMHLSWGAGFLRGCVTFGPPLAAVGRLLGLSRRAG